MTKPPGSPTRRSFLAGLTAMALPKSVFGQQTANWPRHPRGAQVPPRFPFLIRAQNDAAVSLNALLASDTDFLKTNPRLKASAEKIDPKWDWREKGFVTPVKNQGTCGTCWAFAAIGAYESAYAITNQQWAYVSEQELLDCTFADTNCITGGWHQEAFLYMQYLGLIDSDRYYYTGTKGACTANFSREYFILNWGYVGQADNKTVNLIPSDAELKRAIRQYGPVATGVSTVDWDRYWKLDDHGVQNPSWYADFPNGVFKGQASDKNPDHVDHEVLIVGWDDTAGEHGVWIIKNSWGTSWGDGGYMTLAYGSNNIGFGASWVVAPPNSGISPSLAEVLQITKQPSRFGAVRQ